MELSIEEKNYQPSKKMSTQESNQNNQNKNPEAQETRPLGGSPTTEESQDIGQVESPEFKNRQDQNESGDESGQINSNTSIMHNRDTSEAPSYGSLQTNSQGIASPSDIQFTDDAWNSYDNTSPEHKSQANHASSQMSEESKEHDESSESKDVEIDHSSSVHAEGKSPEETEASLDYDTHTSDIPAAEVTALSIKASQNESSVSNVSGQDHSVAQNNTHNTPAVATKEENIDSDVKVLPSQNHLDADSTSVSGQARPHVHNVASHVQECDDDIVQEIQDTPLSTLQAGAQDAIEEAGLSSSVVDDSVAYAKWRQDPLHNLVRALRDGHPSEELTHELAIWMRNAHPYEVWAWMEKALDKIAADALAYKPVPDTLTRAKGAAVDWFYRLRGARQKNQSSHSNEVDQRDEGIFTPPNTTRTPRNGQMDDSDALQSNITTPLVRWPSSGSSSPPDVCGAPSAQRYSSLQSDLGNQPSDQHSDQHSVPGENLRDARKDPIEANRRCERFYRIMDRLFRSHTHDRLSGTDATPLTDVGDLRMSSYVHYIMFNDCPEIEGKMESYWSPVRPNTDLGQGNASGHVQSSFKDQITQKQQPSNGVSHVRNGEHQQPNAEESNSTRTLRANKSPHRPSGTVADDNTVDLRRRSHTTSGTRHQRHLTSSSSRRLHGRSQRGRRSSLNPLHATLKLIRSKRTVHGEHEQPHRFNSTLGHKRTTTTFHSDVNTIHDNNSTQQWIKDILALIPSRAAGQIPRPSAPPVTVAKSIKKTLSCTNFGRRRAQVSFSTALIEPANSARVSFPQESITIKRGCTETFDINVSLLKPSASINILLVLNYTIHPQSSLTHKEGNERHHDTKRIYVLLRARSDTGIFGVPLEHLTFARDAVPSMDDNRSESEQETSTTPANEFASMDGLYLVPWPLKLLRERLYDVDGIKKEGIFRVAPDTIERNRIRRDLQSIHFPTGTQNMSDVPRLSCTAASAASLIKVFLSELPVRLLDGQSDAVLQTACKRRHNAIEMLQKLDLRERHMMMWLCELMAAVCEHQNENRMSAKALAIVFAPSMKDFGEDAPDADQSSIALDYQRVTMLIQHLIEDALETRKSRSK